MPAPDPRYPEEFRREAFALVRSEGRSVGDVAESLGVSEQSLRAWLKLTQLDAGGAEGTTARVRRERGSRVLVSPRRRFSVSSAACFSPALPALPCASAPNVTRRLQRRARHKPGRRRREPLELRSIMTVMESHARTDTRPHGV